MKGVFGLFLSLCLVVLIGCDSTPKTKSLGVMNEGDCALNKVVYRYHSMEVSFDFEYDENMTITGSKKYIDGDLERQNIYSYNDEGLISEVKVFMDDTLTGFVRITQHKDSIVINPLGSNEGGLIDSYNQLHLTLNENKEIVKIEDNIEDSVLNLVHYGSGYINNWINGNVASIANWVLATDSLGKHIVAENFMKKDAYLIDTRAFKYNDRVFYNNIEVEKFYKATFEYDEKHNPFRPLSVAPLILPSNFNTSVNNPIQFVKKYETGEEITYNYSYEYNESNYPEMANVMVKYVNSEKEVVESEFEILFEYNNCK